METIADELAGLTVESAQVLKVEKTGDEIVVIRCTNGSVFEIGAWQREGYPVAMIIERKG